MKVLLLEKDGTPNHVDIQNKNSKIIVWKKRVFVFDPELRMLSRPQVWACNLRYEKLAEDRIRVLIPHSGREWEEKYEKLTTWKVEYQEGEYSVRALIFS